MIGLVSTKSRGSSQKGPDADSILNALPHPVIAIGADGEIVFANVAAEPFFQLGAAILRRHKLEDLVPFGSPLLALVGQVRERAASVNEYGVELGTPRNGGEKLADIQVAPWPIYPVACWS